MGLRRPHHGDVLGCADPPAWLEVHSENYMDSAEDLESLLAARRLFPVSLHGVAISLGGQSPLSRRHLKATKRLIEEVKPGLVSEHLTWVEADGIYLNDLIPLPRTEEALEHICGRVRQMQDYLGRQILVENPVRYIEYASSEIPEPEFLNRLSEKARCRLLLDINNIYVNSENNRFSPTAYIEQIQPDKVGEIHLAGFWRQKNGLLVDSHDRPVQPPVWELYRYAVKRLGRIPTLVEWDGDLPSFAELRDQARLARAILGETEPENIEAMG